MLCKYNYNTYNLLEYFENIEMSNSSLDPVISDLNIFNNNNEIVYIATYYININKQNINCDNNRIIGIIIKAEGDLKVIKNKILSEENENIIFHNFRRRNVTSEDCRNCSRIKITNTQQKKNKYILLGFGGRIIIKHMEKAEFQKIEKQYRHYKKVDLNISYYPQYKEFVNECKDRDYKIIEYNDFW